MERHWKTNEIMRTAADDTRAVQRVGHLSMTDMHAIAYALVRIADTLDEINFRLEEEHGNDRESD